MNSSSDRTATGTVVTARSVAPVPSSGGTQVMPQGPVAFDATVAGDAKSAATRAAGAFAPTHAVGSEDVTLGGAPSSPWRSTVLPKPKAGGVRPELVHSDRPRYQRERVLGEGGMGEVVRSVDNDIERTVAIKRLKADMQAPAHVARFVDEIRTVGSMEHPNIVPIHDVGVDEEGQYFFVMKYVDGDTLESIIERLRAGDPATHARFGYERRVEIFLGVLEAISYAHARGIVHRDLKPANVMVGRYGEVTVMDWGIARVKGRAEAATANGAASSPFQTAAGTLVGTPAYMSPEQARGEPVDERSDVYSLCVMFHELLCLEHYAEGAPTLDEILGRVRERTPKFATLVSSPHQTPVPAELGHFIHKGVAKDPSARYQSIDEMLDRLRRRAEGDFPIQCPITLTKRTTSRWVQFVDRHPAITTALVVGAGIGAIVELARVAMHFALG